MIQPLRKRHLWIWIGWALIMPVAVIVTVTSIPEHKKGTLVDPNEDPGGEWTSVLQTDEILVSRSIAETTEVRLQILVPLKSPFVKANDPKLVTFDFTKSPSTSEG